MLSVPTEPAGAMMPLLLTLPPIVPVPLMAAPSATEVRPAPMDPFICSSPAITPVVPKYVFAPDSVSVPAPIFTNVPVPLITLAYVPSTAWLKTTAALLRMSP
jgi:hypothetical protein